MPKKNVERLSPFGTLENVNDICYSDRWSPTLIGTFEDLISHGNLAKMPKELRKNIAYSLQYLQYIELQLKELHLHNVILTMLYKSYIITSVSIIEGLFHYLLKSNGFWRTKEWEEIKKVPSNQFKFDNIDGVYKAETYIFKKIDKKDDEMNLDSMIKKIEDKNLIDIKHGAFPYIKRLKRLRNKVHLQINEHPDDTDWYSFNKIDYLWTKYTLYRILTNSKFENNDSCIQFLKVDKNELEYLKNDVNSTKEKNSP